MNSNLKISAYIGLLGGLLHIYFKNNPPFSNTFKPINDYGIPLVILLCIIYIIYNIESKIEYPVCTEETDE